MNQSIKLDKIRDEAIMIEVTVPGQKWEFEFLDDRTVDVIKIISHQDLFDANELDILLKGFADIINSLPLGALAVVSTWEGVTYLNKVIFLGK